MSRFFVKNLLFVITVNVLVKPVWALFIDRTVQNIVAPGSYGLYQVLLNVAIIFQIVMDFGITNYNTRTIAQNPDKLKDLFPAMLSARLVLILVYMSLAFCWAWIFGYRGGQLVLLGGVLLIQALNSLVLFIRSNVASLQRFKTDGILSITDRFLMIVICGFMLSYPPFARNFKIEWFVITQVVCYAIAGVAGYMVLRRISGVKLRFHFHGPTILKIMKQSFPYALLIFQMSIYNRSDVIIMERLLGQEGKHEADIWAAAFRLIDQANILGLMFAAILLPMFGRMLSEKQDIAPIIKLCVNMLIPFSFMVAVAGVFFSSDIMHLLYKGSLTEPEYSVVFAWLIASFPAWCIMYIYSTLLTANGSLKTLNYIAFAGVLVNLSLNFYLVPQFKAVGGAMTSLITQSGLSIAFIIFAARTIGLPTNIKWLFAQLGYLVLIIALAYGITTMMRNSVWTVQFVAFGGICVGLMFVFRFISVGAVQQLMAKKA